MCALNLSFTIVLVYGGMAMNVCLDILCSKQYNRSCIVL